jgi:hypothetical protein
MAAKNITASESFAAEMEVRAYYPSGYRWNSLDANAWATWSRKRCKIRNRVEESQEVLFIVMW